MTSLKIKLILLGDIIINNDKSMTPFFFSKKLQKLWVKYSYTFGIM